MLTEIRALHLQLTHALQEHFTRRVEFALGRFAEHVRAVESRVLDLNGPHGGDDKLCAITVHVRGNAPLRVHAIDSNLYAAIDRASGLAGARLAQLLERRRDKRLDAGRKLKRRTR